MALLTTLNTIGFCGSSTLLVSISLLILSCGNSNSEVQKNAASGNNESGFDTEVEIAAINQVFNAFIRDQYDDDGVDFQLYSEKFHREMKAYALNALHLDTANVYDYNMWEVSTLLTLRSQFSDEELSSKSGEEITRIFMENSILIVRENAQLEELTFGSPQSATAKHLLSGSNYNYISFDQENGKWLVNLVPSKAHMAEKEKELLEFFPKKEGIDQLISMIGGRI